MTNTMAPDPDDQAFEAVYVGGLITAGHYKEANALCLLSLATTGERIADALEALASVVIDIEGDKGTFAVMTGQWK
jgi:hypothetical protein